MLGMFLVVVLMALLLGGTLHGLASYRAVMGACDCKLEELSKAVAVKEEISKLKRPTAPPGLQTSELLDRIQPIKAKLDDYCAELAQTVDKGRVDDAKTELDYVKYLRTDIEELDKALRDEAAHVDHTATGGQLDLLDRNPILRKKIFETETHISDLIDITTKQIHGAIQTTRKEARKSIMLLISSGIMAVLLMAGLLRFFYRWVAEPIRELEEGVGRVARGDFQHRIEINSGDEIEDLAKAYNGMTDKLRAMYENLAQQVNERSRQLVRSEQLAGVGFLAAGVAHEINNPLASIALAGEALESRLKDLLRTAPIGSLERETIIKYLKMIQEEAFRCKDITQKLLAFSRGGERKREQVNLADIIQGVLDVVKHLQSCKGKRIDFPVAEPMFAWVNAQEIKQVFLNLVVNALECMDEGGILSITHVLRDGRFELVFTDTGCGMTPDVLQNIFQPFFTRSRTGKGTGLGLSISHRIVTQHGGEIEAVSDGPGHGSTFSVRLPIQPVANEAENGQEVQDPVEEFLKLSSAKQSAKAA